jgi:hypothetical protein
MNKPATTAEPAQVALPSGTATLSGFFRLGGRTESAIVAVSPDGRRRFGLGRTARGVPRFSQGDDSIAPTR